MNEPRVVKSVTNECQSLGRAHESSSARAEQLIACLEGEIAKRDARIVELQLDVIAWKETASTFEDFYRKTEMELARVTEADANYQAEALRLAAELAAIKAQEPVAWVGTIEDGVPLLVVEPQNWKATPLFAAPVSEAKAQSAAKMPCGAAVSNVYEAYDAGMKAAKAQGVVMPELIAGIQARCLEGMDGAATQAYGALSAIHTMLDEVARLNAAPVQQVRVPDGYARVPTGLTDEMLRAMKIQLDKSPVVWCRYRAAYRAMLAAAPAPGGE